MQHSPATGRTVSWRAIQAHLQPQPSPERAAPQRQRQADGDTGRLDRLAGWLERREAGDRNFPLFYAAKQAALSGLLDGAGVERLVDASLRSGLRGGEPEARRTIESGRRAAGQARGRPFRALSPPRLRGNSRRAEMTTETTTETRAHGTRARYVHGPGPGSGPGCRCGDCRAANRAAESGRERQILYGRWQPYVNAGPAREHLRALAEAGIGWKRAAKLAAVSTGAVSKILYGGPGTRPPSRRVRAQTAAAILAVRPSPGQLAPGALTDNTGARRRLQALVTTGWSQARLGRELGMTPANFGSMMRGDQVTAATARAVGELYDRLWNQPPPEHDAHARIAASRARNYARARNWAPPLAWDDDQIDLPDGSPAEGWQRPARTTRRGAELAEDAEELFRREGYTREQAAGRLGVSPAALEAALRRTQRAREIEHEEQRAIFAHAAAPAVQPGYEAEAG